jgi:SnoaL-like protein
LFLSCAVKAGHPVIIERAVSQPEIHAQRPRTMTRWYGHADRSIVCRAGRRRRDLADNSLADKIACAELIQAWGVARDQGKWKELRATFTPDGHISVSWFRGSFEQFVERCRSAFNAGHTWSRHHLFPPTIKLNGDRATAETSVVIRVRQKFNGIDVDLTSCSRFLDRVERHSGGWLIAERAAIYERDRLDPVEPSAAFDELFAAANTAQYPEQYRYMAFRLAHSEGRTLAPVIYRDGGAETADLYARFSDFLAGKSS